MASDPFLPNELPETSSRYPPRHADLPFHDDVLQADVEQLHVAAFASAVEVPERMRLLAAVVTSGHLKVVPSDY